MTNGNGTELPEERTRKTTHFPEAVGKIVKNIQVDVTLDHFSATVNFADNTAIVLSLEPCLTLFPYYGAWHTGECEVLKKWETIHSILLST